MLRVVVAGLPGGPRRHLAVGRAEVDEVEPVAHDRRRSRPRRRLLAERGDLLVAVVDRPPGARVVREHLEALAAEVAPPPDRLRDASGRGDVGAESHAHYPTGRGTRQTRGDRTGARALRPEPDRQPPCGRGPHGPLQLAHRPAHRAAPSCCAWRTPTASARRPRARPRSCAASPGSGSTGTRARSARASAATSTRTPSTRLKAAGAIYPAYETDEEVDAQRAAARADKRAPVVRGQPRPHPDEIAELEAGGPPPGLALRRGAPGPRR